MRYTTRDLFRIITFTALVCLLLTCMGTIARLRIELADERNESAKWEKNALYWERQADELASKHLTTEKLCDFQSLPQLSY